MSLISIIITSMIISILIVVPISFKWELRLDYISSYVVFLGLFVAATIYILNSILPITRLWIFILEILLVIFISLAILAWRFYRDPERELIEDDKNIYSPADGKIVYVEKIKEGNLAVSQKKKRKYKLEEFTSTNLLEKSAYHIGIGMSFLDVHVNRSPISGEVKFLKHIKGTFKSLKLTNAFFENERSIIIIEGKQIKVGVVQIASRLVRMIVPFVKQNEFVPAGKRIGKIRFGSQVDLIIPQTKKMKVLVSKNDFVKAGVTVIAKII